MVGGGLYLFDRLPSLLTPLGTTILGVVAVGLIRHSKGKLYGLPLAVFDALLFPLLLIDGLIIVGSLWLWEEALRGSGHERPMFILWRVITVGLIVFVNVMIVRMTWRAANDVQKPKPEPKPITRATVFVGVMSLLCVLAALVITGLTILLAVARQNAEQAGEQLSALLRIDPMSLFYLSLLAILTGLVCGIVSWRHPTGKVGAITCGILPLMSLLFM